VHFALWIFFLFGMNQKGRKDRDVFWTLRHNATADGWWTGPKFGIQPAVNLWFGNDWWCEQVAKGSSKLPGLLLFFLLSGTEILRCRHASYATVNPWAKWWSVNPAHVHVLFFLLRTNSTLFCCFAFRLGTEHNQKYQWLGAEQRREPVARFHRTWPDGCPIKETMVSCSSWYH